MATYEDVAAVALQLSDVTEGTKWRRRTWNVRGQGFAYERPLSKADLKGLGDEPAPEGPILGLRTEDLHEKTRVVGAGQSRLLHDRALRQLPRQYCYGWTQ